MCWNSAPVLMRTPPDAGAVKENQISAAIVGTQGGAHLDEAPELGQRGAVGHGREGGAGQIGLDVGRPCLDSPLGFVSGKIP